MTVMLTLDERRKRLGFRAGHRGVKEADILIGSFVARHALDWSAAEIAWFERLLEESDRDILAWVTGAEPCPEVWRTPIMAAMQKLDYLPTGG